MALESKGEIAICVLEEISRKVVEVTHVRSGFSVREKEVIVTNVFLQSLHFFLPIFTALRVPDLL